MKKDGISEISQLDTKDQLSTTNTSSRKMTCPDEQVTPRPCCHHVLPAIASSSSCSSQGTAWTIRWNATSMKRTSFPALWSTHHGSTLSEHSRPLRIGNRTGIPSGIRAVTRTHTPRGYTPVETGEGTGLPVDRGQEGARVKARARVSGCEWVRRQGGRRRRVGVQVRVRVRANGCAGEGKGARVSGSEGRGKWVRG